MLVLAKGSHREAGFKVLRILARRRNIRASAIRRAIEDTRVILCETVTHISPEHCSNGAVWNEVGGGDEIGEPAGMRGLPALHADGTLHFANAQLQPIESLGAHIGILNRGARGVIHAVRLEIGLQFPIEVFKYRAFEIQARTSNQKGRRGIWRVDECPQLRLKKTANLEFEGALISDSCCFNRNAVRPDLRACSANAGTGKIQPLEIQRQRWQLLELFLQTIIARSCLLIGFKGLDFCFQAFQLRPQGGEVVLGLEWLCVNGTDSHNSKNSTKQ